MIEFYVYVNYFSDFRDGIPVQWCMALAEFTDTIHVVRLRMNIDEVEFVSSQDPARPRCLIRRRKPLHLTLKEGEITKV